MTELIHCDFCNVVFVNRFTCLDRYNDQELREFCNDSLEVFKYLKKNKTRIVVYYGDLEQTSKSFMKWCPVCNDGCYFSEVEI